MIDRGINSIIIFYIILCFMLITVLPEPVESAIEVDPQNTYATFEYDDNVTREGLRKDYQYGIIWRLYTGFDIKNIIPIRGLDSKAGYTLGMRDVNTTNNEDYNSHTVILTSETEFKTDTDLYLKEEFKIWNSQSDLFNFYDNLAMIRLEQPFGRKTTARLSYVSEQKWFQNDEPEVQARNFFYHQIGTELNHRISNTFGVLVGYVYQISTYNRSPIYFKGRKPVALPGTQQDRQNVLTLGFWVFLLDNTHIELLNHVVSSNSNSSAFNFSGNRIGITLLSTPIQSLLLELTYRIVAYELGAYQTPTMGYELSEIRTDDQSGVKLGATYKISDQMSLQLGYEHIENTVFFTREFYKKNIFSTGLKIKF